MIRLKSFISSLNRISDISEPDTKDHTRRTSQLAVMIARKLKLPRSVVQSIGYAADIHDVGKIGVSANILLKPSRLTNSEFVAMRKHSEYGFEIVTLAGLTGIIPESIRWHHEHWDGSGYPDKLKENQIPIWAAITCMSDVWDSLTSKRPYRPAMCHKKACKVMHENEKWFNPLVFEIWKRYME